MAENLIEIVLRARDMASKDLKNVEGRLGSLASSAMKAGGIMMGVGAGVSAAMFGIVKSAANAGDEIAKLSKRTGIATETLSEYRHVAELNDASLAGFAKGLKTLATNMLYAEQGMSTSVQAFKEANLSWKDGQENLKALDVMFGEIADRIAAETNETKALALATQLLGRGGMELFPILKMGSAAIAEQRAETHALGEVWSEEAAAAAEQFNDDLTRLKGTLKGTGKEIAVSLLPQMIEFVQKATDVGKGIVAWTHEHRTLIPLVLKTSLAIMGAGGLLVALGAIVKIAPMVGLAFHSMLGPIGLLTAGIGLLVGQAIIADIKFKGMADTVERAGKLGDLPKTVTDLVPAVGELSDAQYDLNLAIAEYAAAQEVVRNNENANLAQKEKAARALIEARARVEELATALIQESVANLQGAAATSAATGATEKATEVAESYSGVLADIIALEEKRRSFPAPTITGPVGEEGLKPVTPEGTPTTEAVPAPTATWADEARAAVDSVVGSMTSLYDVVQNVAMGMTNAFSSAFSNIFAAGQTFAGWFKGLLGGIGQAIWNALSQFAAAKLVTFIFGLFGGGGVVTAATGGIVRAATGGVLHAQHGILAGGTSGKDSIPVMAMPGEAFLDVKTTKQLERILNTRVGTGAASGGQVPAPAYATAPQINVGQLVAFDRYSMRQMIRSGELNEEIRRAFLRGDF